MFATSSCKDVARFQKYLQWETMIMIYTARTHITTRCTNQKSMLTPPHPPKTSQNTELYGVQGIFYFLKMYCITFNYLLC